MAFLPCFTFINEKLLNNSIGSAREFEMKERAKLFNEAFNCDKHNGKYIFSSKHNPKIGKGKET